MIDFADRVTLLDFAQHYILAHDITSHHAASYKRHVRMLCEWMGRTLYIDELNGELVNGWLFHLRESSSRSSKTLNDYRNSILRLWKIAYEDELIQKGPKRIRKFKVPRNIPIAWTLAELGQICKTAEGMIGCCPKSAIPFCVYFPAFIHFTYETGFRCRDVLATKRTDLSEHIISITQRKTGLVVTRAISETTLAKLEKVWELSPNDVRMLPWFARAESFFYHFRRLVRMSGVRYGTSRFLRRSGASYSERLRPGSAAEYCGHASEPRLAHRHYIDRTISNDAPMLPPPIPE